MRVGALGSLLKPTPDESRPLKPRREGLWRSFLPFPHTETSPYLQNAAKARGFERSFHVRRSALHHVNK